MRPSAQAGAPSEAAVLSPAEEQLWHFAELAPGNPVYNAAFTICKDGALNVDALHAAFNEIVRRHEIWRTTYAVEDGEPLRIVRQPTDIAIPHLDLSALPEDERATEAVRRLGERLRAPYDLASGPLIRPTLARFSATHHRLYVGLHHLVFDGVTVNRVMFPELVTLYHAFAAGEASPLPEPTIQYAAYASEERACEMRGAQDARLEHWRQRLEGAAALHLPTDHARPRRQQFRGAGVPLHLSKALVDGLRTVRAASGATFFQTIATALAVLLHRYSGQDDIVFGTVVDMRLREELHDLAGYCMTPMVIRTDLQGNPPFAELLLGTRRQLLADLDQRMPFERLVRDLQPPRTPGVNPIFQVALVVVHRARVPDQDWTVQLIDPALSTAIGYARFDLEFELEVSAEGDAAGRIVYDVDLFSPETVRRMAETLTVLIEGIVASPGTGIDDLPVLTAAATRRLLVDGNGPHMPLPDPATVHGLVAAQAARTPDAPAVCDANSVLTYAELEDRAGRFARHLQGLGVVRNDIVGVTMQRSTDLVVALLAILKAGAAYLPLEPDHPRRRLELMVEEARPRVIVTTGDLAAAIEGCGGPVLRVDDERAVWMAHDRVEVDDPHPEDLAYVLYTSGSTGAPKGVMIEHRAIVNQLCWRVDSFGLQPDDRVLQKTPLGFDVSVWELFCPLISGATLVMLAPEDHVDPVRIAEAVQAQRITAMHFVPSMLHTFLDTVGTRGCESLRLVVASGERLTPEVCRRFFEHFGTQTHLRNLYGPTEAAVDVSWWECRPSDAEVPIGRPVANTRIHVLDAQLRPVPPGAPGELCIGGAQLARGYLNQPELTAQRFVADPFNAGQRLYRTGDVGRVRPDGVIEYLGRRDDQVKIRGTRIELGEVEAAIRTHPGVRQAVAALRTDDRGEPRLVAYLVAPGLPSARAHGELSEYLATRLPAVMVPSALMVIDALPLTPSGKVDRNALPAPDWTPEPTAPFVAPRTAAEASVAAIWARIFAVDRVGVHDSFFELGGHSLLAARLLTDVDRELDVHIGLGTMFESGLTVAGMAALVEAERRERGEAAPVEDAGRRRAGTPVLAPRRRAGPAPLSAAEAQLWYFTQLAPDSPVYNEAFTIRNEGPLEVQALVSALNEVVRRHEILRSTFDLVAGEPVQIVDATRTVDVPLVDLSRLSPEERDRELDRLRAEDRNRPYRVDREPLIRPRLIRLGPEQHTLDLGIHHLVFDAASLRIVLAELIILYDAFAENRPSPLPAPTIQYADYAEWERAWTASADFSRRIDYWRGRLDGAPPLQMPLDRPRGTEQSFRGAAVEFEIPPELATQLRSLSRQQGSTLFQTLMATFTVLLHRYSGQDDVVFGTIADQRQGPELLKMVGYCVTPLVLRCDVSGEPAFTTLLGRVRTRLLEAMSNQVPFEALVRELQPVRQRAANPLFQVMMVMQPHGAAPLPSWDLQPLPRPPEHHDGRAKFELAVNLDERPDGGIAAQLDYNSDLFDDATATAMAEHWAQLLRVIVAAPDLPVGDLPMLSAEERERQLVVWNTTAVAYPGDAQVHHLVAEQASRTPDAVAVREDHNQLTYAELEARSGRLAGHLRELGMGTEAVVGVCMRRSIDMVVGLLGILKAGAAFLPLEPDQPVARLATMVLDARPAVVLTTAADSAVLRGMAVPLLHVDTDRAAWMSRPSVGSASCRPENLAYVMFTSGSTGAPKGVMIEHRSLVNQLRWKQESFAVTAADRWLQRAPLGFDPAVSEIFCPLIGGATTVLAGPGEHADVRRLRAAVRHHRVTILSLVPSVLEEFLEHGGADGCESVRLITVGGESVTAALARRALQVFGHGVELRNMYGPTEATISATWWRCGPEDDPVPIGRPIANTRAYVVDSRLRPVPVGTRGELCIGGVQVARGYISRPDLTAERFAPDPFVAGERLYRTGDIARQRRDGAIEFIGRNDGQVKLRGVRTELGEIEAALAAAPGVRQAVAALRDDGDGRPRVVAYVVAADAASQPTLRALRASLSQRLPQTMLPSALVMIDAVPSTASGKVDRAALPEPDWRSAAPFTAPRSATERRVAAVWARILGLERIGMDDNFFELGGHSLLAVRLLAEVERQVGVAVPLSVFFGTGATVSSMAELIDATRSGSLRGADAHGHHPTADGAGDTPIVFFVHPSESSMLTIRHFITPLGYSGRVVGLLPERIGQRFDRRRTVEDLAVPMLRTIREAQPHGPYYLAGFSFGGLLAYELAGRLRADGDEVGWLGLLDCGAPSLSGSAMRRRLSARERLARQRQRGLVGATRKTYEVAARELRAGLLRLHLRRPRLSDDFDYRGAGHLARAYVVRGNDAPMDLFRTADAMHYNGSESLGWAEVHRGALRVHDAPGDHLTMVTEPHVQVLAAMVARCVRQAESERRAAV